MTRTSTDPHTRIDAGDGTDAPSGDANLGAEHTGEGASSGVEAGHAPAGAAAAESTGVASSDSRTPDDIKYDLIAMLKTVYDPEIPVDIYELGLIYEAEVGEAGDVKIVMTLTSPMCPVAETLPPEVEAKAREVEGVTKVDLELVWEPPWSVDMMSAAARLELNI